MKTIGYFVLAIGILWLVVALNMDTSVATDYGRVNNIGLMASKQNHILIGGFLAICGLIMSIFCKGSQASTLGTVKCPFCAEPINPEAIKCKHCGGDVGDKLKEIKDSSFKPSDMSFDSFFIRKNDGFDINHNAIKELAERLKKSSPNSHPMNIWEKNKSEIELLKNQMPSTIRDPFEKELKKKF